MLHNFNEVTEKAKTLGKVKISVAVAQDEGVMEAVKMAYDAGFADPILVGKAGKIKAIAQELGFPEQTEIIDVPDTDDAALKATSLVREGKARILMKGLINSSNFLRAALNKEYGLRSGKLLNHLMAFEIPGSDKLVFHTDGGMNIAPSLEDKKQILINSIEALYNMGIDCPNVAVLTANEQVNPKMPATVDAAALVEMGRKHELPKCVIEGPIALDVALSPKAAAHKSIRSQVSGKVDLFLVPNIEAGNLFGKSLIYYAGAQAGGLILGATNPIVLVSRNESARGKFNAIALACLALKRE